ncbi:MAG TPA: hypothetical protein VGQ46_05745 [Thermoanaerobaculia bacterium]|nr:hypothetical protein [Thermoanaerobaculia bacterium]
MLIDESLPKPLRRDLPGFESFTVQQRGWSQTKNGALLRLAESAGFDAFLTADQSLQFQQNLTNSKLRIIVFQAVSNRIEHIRPLVARAIAALREMAEGEIRIISSS